MKNKKDIIQVKKAHTLKAMAIVTPSKLIKYLSPIYIGKSHDFLY
jgi:hypothetical protein